MSFFSALEKNFIFFPERLPPESSFSTLREKDEEVFLRTKDGVRIHCLFYKGEKPFAFLYLHGNAGSLKEWQYVTEDLLPLGGSLLLLDYRGYGKSDGEITEEGIYEDARASYEFLVEEKKFPPQALVVYGRSIGSAPALFLAENFPSGALILETPFTSLRDLARYHYPFLPPGVPRSFTMNNLKRAEKISIPTLILHGDHDTIVPLSQGKSLFEAIPSSRKEFFLFPGGTHNNLSSFPQYKKILQEFLSRVYPNLFP
jgi:hypothetical protein